MDPEAIADDAPRYRLGSARQLGLIAATLFLAIAGLNYRWEAGSTTAENQYPADRMLPDAVVEDPLLDVFDSTGKKVRQLNGQKLDYYDSDKHSVILAPRIKFEQRSGDTPPTPWQMTADTATTYQSNNRVDLEGNIRLWSDATRGGRTEILTEKLLVDTSRQFAETDKAVTIRTGNSEAKALGIRADLANERMLLPSRVKEIHEVRR